MTRKRWRKLLVRTYVVGYVLYVFAAAVLSWPWISTFSTWVYYIAFQCVYAFAWPFVVLLDLVGIRW